MAITSLCPGGLAQSCERRLGHFPAMALREAKAVVTAAPTVGQIDVLQSPYRLNGFEFLERFQPIRHC
jgi:hypothetical protein